VIRCPARHDGVLALLGLAATLAIAFSTGCGGGAGGGGGGSADVQAGMDVAKAELLSLPTGLSTEEQNQQLAAYMAALPQFQRAVPVGENGDGGVVALFANGEPYAIINDGNGSPDAGAAATAGAAHALAARSGLPSGKTALPMRAMGTAFTDARGDLQAMLTNAGYNVTPQDGGVENVRRIRGPDVFYFDTHGVYDEDFLGPGNGIAVAWTSTPAPPGDHTYDAECASPDPTICRMTALDHYDADGRQVLVDHYGVTDKFIARNGITFATNSLVYMDCCFLNAGLFNQASRTAGASLYVGWTDKVAGDAAVRAAQFCFDRMLGANSGKPDREDPIQRPFDYQAVWNDLASRGWNTSGAATINFTPGGGDDGMLAPSIQFLTLHEAPFFQTDKTRMDIAGLFGNDPGESRRKVTIAETPVEVSSWAPDKVTCDIPNFGEGSVGDVVVAVNDHKSNKVPLTEWNIKFTYTRHYWGSLTDTFHINAHIRVDVHKWRDQPHQTPNTPSAVLFKGMADMDGDWTSEGVGHENNDPSDDWFAWSGSGLLSGQHALWDGEGTTAVGFVNVESMFIEINPCGVAGLNKTVDIYTTDGSHLSIQEPAWANLMPVFDEFVDGQTYIKIPVNSSFGVEAGSRSATSNIDGSPLPDGESATMEWEAAEASFTPDQTVHASGLLQAP